jgi:signal transduction histidine kinase
LSAPADPGRSLRGRLHAWSARRLAHRLSLAAGTLTVALLALALVAGLLLTRWTAEAYTRALLDGRAAQAAQRVAHDLAAIEADVDALARNSFVVNALTDSAGRDAYLGPFLRQHPLRTHGVALRVCDGANVPIGSDGSDGSDGRDGSRRDGSARGPTACAAGPEARAVLADGRSRATIVGSGDGGTLRWLVPVRFPLTGTHEGLVVAALPLAALMHDDMAVHEAGRAPPRAVDAAVLDRRVALGAGSAAAALPLVVRVTLPPDTGRLPFAPVVAGYALVGVVLLLVALAGTRRLAARIVAPLNDLADLSRRASEQAPLSLPPALDRPDEIGGLARAFAQMAGTMHDANRRLAEQVDALTEARNQAQAASVAKGEFLAVMSHEIRTPMNAVLGMLYLTLQAPLGPRQRDQIERAHRAAQALLHVINDVLDFSKADAGRTDVRPAPFSPAELVAGVVDTVEIAAEQKGLRLEAVCDAGLPARLLGDAGRLRQVLVNLVGNAVKFTEHGRVTLRLAAGNAAGTLVASVEDTGIGLTPEEQSRLFEPFTQMDSSTARRHEGTGLGLAISHRLVAAMGGTLHVDSRKGEGTRFWFALPLVPAAAELPPEAAPAAAAPAPAVQRPQRVEALVGRCVLVVDDHEANRIVARGMLELLGLRSLQACDGDEALALLADGPPVDAVLLDVHMPGLDGYETARRIRADTRWRDLPVLAMTADTRDEDRDAARAAGMDDHLVKPLALATLREALIAHLADRPAPVAVG